jgi:hypothetical protein
MTTTITTEEFQTVLSDYTIRLTGQEESAAPQQESQSTTQLVHNPESWPTDRRRIPNYRPIDRSRTQEERPNGSNGFEQAFLTMMFTGVVLNAVRNNSDPG